MRFLLFPDDKDWTALLWTSGGGRTSCTSLYLVQTFCWRAVRGRWGLECTLSCVSQNILAWYMRWSKMLFRDWWSNFIFFLGAFFVQLVSQSRLHLPTCWSKCGLSDVHSLITASVFEVLCLNCFIIPWWLYLINSWKTKKKKKEGDLCQLLSQTRSFQAVQLGPWEETYLLEVLFSIRAYR